jgi:hypothetical protein
MQKEPTLDPLVEYLSSEQERYVKLANLKTLDPSKPNHADEMWHIIRGLAVLDWAMLQPEKPDNAEERWRTMMRKIHQLAQTIQEEQSGHNGYKH